MSSPSHLPSTSKSPSPLPRRSTVRHRWTATEADQVLQSARVSGLTLNAFARRYGLCSRQLYWWRDRLRAQPQARATAPRATAEPPLFIRIVGSSPAAPTSAGAAAGAGVSIHIGGFCVELQPGFCDHTLARALAVVAAKAGASC